MKGGLVRTGGEEAYEDYGKEEKEGAKTTGRSTEQDRKVKESASHLVGVRPSIRRFIVRSRNEMMSHTDMTGIPNT